MSTASTDPDRASTAASALDQALEALRESEHRQQVMAEELQRAQKLLDIATLAGGIAHETNNMMTVVLGFGSQLAREMEPDDSRQALLAEMTRAAERTAHMTSQLLMFSRRQVTRAEAIDLGQTLRGIEALIRRLVVKDTAIAFDIETNDEPLVARIDRNQLEQVILNLAINARDALPRGGLLRIRADRFDLAASVPLDSGGTLAPGSYGRLTVEDSGHGMSQDMLDRIFEPFFTTKPEGRGTGLGLSVVQAIITQNGGSIDVASRVGRGTLWTLYLPRVDEMPVARDQISDEMRQPRQPYGTVLVVDDEPPIRAFAEYALKRAGFRVLQAEHGSAALALLDQGAPIDAVLTDLTMPNMGGRELARRIALRHPQLPVVYMTGHAEDMAHGSGVPQDLIVVRKPFRSSELARAVRAALGLGPAA